MDVKGLLRIWIFIALMFAIKNGHLSQMIANGVPINEAKCSQVARSFGSSMSVKVGTYSGYNIMQSSYERRAADREFTVHKRDNAKIVNKIVQNLEKFLRKKLEAVKRSVDTIENASQFFDWKSSPNPAYYNVQFLNTDPEEVSDEYKSLQMSLPLKSDYRFMDRAVNLNTSVVQVPYEVYGKATQVVRSVELSKVLNTQFKLNSDLDPSLKWQYFGSTDGFLRIFPGFQWKMVTSDGHPNIYDCRKRMWYTEASSFARDVLILVDRSGSMKGLKMAIAERIVSTVLETLSDNDFFNILAFSDTVQFVNSCLNDTLVSATTAHKKTIFESLTKIVPQNIAELGSALEFTLQNIISFQNQGFGSACYSAIMIITDGTAGNYQDIIARNLNNTDHQIRIFTYAVGRESNGYIDSVEEIACNNAGYFHQIESINDASEKVLQYLTVMNRPQAVKSDHQTTWTKSHYDTSQGDDGFGLICTVAMPAYLKRQPSSLLGVMATDITVDQMMDVLSIHKSGVNAFAFMVTNNGNVVFHPRLITKYTDVYNRLQIKENYNGIDVRDLESQDTNETLRTALVRQAKGQLPSQKVLTSLDDWRRPVFQSGTFHYSPVFGTPYSIAVFIPDGYGNLKLSYGNNLKLLRHGVTYTENECDEVNEHLMKNNHRNINRVSASCSLNFSDVSIAGKWKYCQFIDGRDHNTDPTITQWDMLRSYVLKNRNDIIKCDADILNGVLFDSYITAALYPLWTEQSQYNNTLREGIELTFITTQSGVTRQFWHEDDSASYEVAKSLFNSFGKQSFPDFYRRTATFPQDKWVYTALTTDSSWYNTNTVLITRALHLKGAILGVVGMFMKYQKFSSSFWGEISDISGVGCSREGGTPFDCYVIDEHGNIVISNQLSQERVGKYIGNYDGDVARHLIEEGIYSIVEIRDNTSICYEYPSPKTAALKGASVSMYLKKAFGIFLHGSEEFINVIFYPCLGQYINHNSFSVLLQVVWSSFITKESEAAVINEPIYRECNKLYPVTIANNSNIPYTGAISCEGFDGSLCVREVGLFAVANSNLYMLVVENIDYSCTCGNKSENKYVLDSKEVFRSEEEECKMLKENKLRRRPNGCKEHHYTIAVENYLDYPCSNSKSSAAGLLAQSWNGRLHNTQRDSSASILFLSTRCFVPYFIVTTFALFSFEYLSLIPT